MASWLRSNISWLWHWVELPWLLRVGSKMFRQFTETLIVWLHNVRSPCSRFWWNQNLFQTLLCRKEPFKVPHCIYQTWTSLWGSWKAFQQFSFYYFFIPHHLTVAFWIFSCSFWGQLNTWPRHLLRSMHDFWFWLILSSMEGRGGCGEILMNVRRFCEKEARTYFHKCMECFCLLCGWEAKQIN